MLISLSSMLASKDIISIAASEISFSSSPCPKPCSNSITSLDVLSLPISTSMTRLAEVRTGETPLMEKSLVELCGHRDESELDCGGGKGC